MEKSVLEDVKIVEKYESMVVEGYFRPNCGSAKRDMITTEQDIPKEATRVG